MALDRVLQPSRNRPLHHRRTPSVALKIDRCQAPSLTTSSSRCPPRLSFQSSMTMADLKPNHKLMDPLPAIRLNYRIETRRNSPRLTLIYYSPGHPHNLMSDRFSLMPPRNAFYFSCHLLHHIAHTSSSQPSTCIISYPTLPLPSFTSKCPILPDLPTTTSELRNFL